MEETIQEQTNIDLEDILTDESSSSETSDFNDSETTQSEEVNDDFYNSEEYQHKIKVAEDEMNSMNEGEISNATEKMKRFLLIDRNFIKSVNSSDVGAIGASCHFGAAISMKLSKQAKALVSNQAKESFFNIIQQISHNFSDDLNIKETQTVNEMPFKLNLYKLGIGCSDSFRLLGGTHTALGFCVEKELTKPIRRSDDIVHKKQVCHTNILLE